jgi:hypothetical protein
MLTAVLHKGLMEDCRVCSPDSVKKDDRKRKRKTKGEVTLDLNVRRQVAQELGEDEPTKDQRFILLQKFGVTAPRIDRRITRPAWMSEGEWQRKMNDWHKATKGLVPQTQPRTFQRHTRENPNHRPNQQARPQDTRTSRGNYGRGRTDNRPR